LPSTFSHYVDEKLTLVMESYTLGHVCLETPIHDAEAWSVQFVVTLPGRPTTERR